MRRTTAAAIVCLLASPALHAQVAAPPPFPSPAAAGAVSVGTKEDTLVSFDAAHVEVMRSEDGWQLRAGTRVLKNFGRHEEEARQALRLVREMRLNGVATIGSPPAVEYWLSDGHAPQGMVTGLKTIPIDRTSVTAAQLQGQWCVRDRWRVLLNFGRSETDARQALAAIIRHGFSEVAVIGTATPSMMIFLARPDGVRTPRTVTRMGPADKPDQPDSKQQPGQGNPLPSLAEHGSLARKIQDRHPGAGIDHLVPAAIPSLKQPEAPRLQTNARPPASQPQGSGRVPFDWRQVQVKYESGGYVLASGSLILGRFGSSERDARQALAAIQHYRLTEQHQIGRPRPVFSYYLSAGQVPRGVVLGTQVETIVADQLKAVQVEEGWAVCQGQRPLVVVGERVEDANEVIRVIRRHQFDRLCQIGPPGQGFTLLLRDR